VRKKQLTFPQLNLRASPRSHGGELSIGKRKTARPFDPKQALHVVLRSSQARGKLSMLHPDHCNAIGDLLERLKTRWNIQIYRYANVGNHIHLLIRAKTRKAWQGFIRELSGAIAMMVTGAKKGHPSRRPAAKTSFRGFWDHLVFTRIVRFGRDFQNAARYVSINFWESHGVRLRELIEKGYKVFALDHGGAILFSG
jgi:REP element-mobilizing transposase RayT